MTNLEVKPICTLAQPHGYVLVITDSGVTSTPHGAYVARRRSDGTVRDFDNEHVDIMGCGPILGWMELPFTVDAVARAVAEGERLANPGAPMLTGHVDDHIAFARQVVREMADAIGPRRAILKLHARLGDNVDGPHLPDNVPLNLYSVRMLITDWAKGLIDDDHVIDQITNALRD